ncbi:MAG: glutamate--tRNA ligase [Coriobacteriales bacterium]|nr:glutamate--tRNA ligase [Coriobacteriales bacterium]
MPENVRVRFAPSPTGHLHIGGARTAVYNWAFARRYGGQFILRIDDTDPERSTQENTEAIMRAMRWLGLDWDEGPEAGGSSGPYLQSERGPLYRDGLLRMIEAGAAYPCFCSTEELEAQREAARAEGGYATYDRACRQLAKDEVKARLDAGEAHVWRLAVPEGRGDIMFTDAVRGPVSFPAEAMDDYIIVRSDGTPTYNFVTVLDDAGMGITHVIRGDDHLANTPRQILVYEALGEPVPTFAHMSMIWGSDGKRLSKRHGATSVEAYRDMGYLPDALINYIALLGWSIDDKTTLFDRATLVEKFALDRISKNPAIFDPDKLEWMNGVYIRDMPPQAFVHQMVPWLDAAGLASADDIADRNDWFLALTPLVTERVKRMDEIAPMVRFLFEDIEIDDTAREKVLAKEGAGEALRAAADALRAVEDWNPAAIEAAIRDIPPALDLKPKLVFQAVRVAITGSAVSPPLFESVALLGRERSVERVEAALASI